MIEIILGLLAWLVLAIPAVAICLGNSADIEDDIDIHTEQ